MFMMLKVIPSSLQLALYVEEGQTGRRLKTGFVTKPRAITCYLTTDNVHASHVLHIVYQLLHVM